MRVIIKVFACLNQTMSSDVQYTSHPLNPPLSSDAENLEITYPRTLATRALAGRCQPRKEKYIRFGRWVRRRLFLGRQLWASGYSPESQPLGAPGSCHPGGNFTGIPMLSDSLSVITCHPNPCPQPFQGLCRPLSP